jgi:peptide/nickel transport system permease protein
MLKYVARRLLLLPLVLFGVTFLLFMLTQFLSPEMRASLYIKDPRQLNSIEQIIEKHGLRDPVIKQYGRWMGNLIKGDLGYSETAKMPVSKAIKSYLPATIELAILSIIPITLLGIWLGTLSAVKKNKFADNVSRFISITGYSLPGFVLGLLLLMIFYGKLHWFPPGRYGLTTDMALNAGNFKNLTGFLLLDTLLNLNFPAFFDTLKHMILPVLTLTYGTMALQMRVMRSSMLEELSKDYVRTARAKGLAESQVIKNHARKNAIIPVITLASLQFVRLLGGVVIAETVFDYPGIGRWGVTCAQQLDIPGVLGFTMMTALLFVIGNMVADILYASADPRIRLN